MCGQMKKVPTKDTRTNPWNMQLLILFGKGFFADGIMALEMKKIVDYQGRLYIQ